jgi:hypothetical protein
MLITPARTTTGGPPADLVLVEAGESLAGLEVLLDRPPAAGDADQGA